MLNLSFRASAKHLTEEEGEDQEEGEWTTNDISHRRGGMGGAEGRMMEGEVEAEERESEDGGCDDDVFFSAMLRPKQPMQMPNARASQPRRGFPKGSISPTP